MHGRHLRAAALTRPLPLRRTPLRADSPSEQSICSGSRGNSLKVRAVLFLNSVSQPRQRAQPRPLTKEFRDGAWGRSSLAATRCPTRPRDGLGVEGGDRGGRVGRWDPRTGSGTTGTVGRGCQGPVYTDAEGKCRVEALLFEEFGAMSAGVEELLMRVAEVAGRKLTWWQYDQTSWSAREWMPFALQRLSVQLWVALADEAQRAIGAASRDREGPRGNTSGMGGSEGKGAGGAQ